MKTNTTKRLFVRTVFESTNVVVFLLFEHVVELTSFNGILRLDVRCEPRYVVIQTLDTMTTHDLNGKLIDWRDMGDEYRNILKEAVNRN